MSPLVVGHWLLVVLYVVAPLVLVGLAVRSRRFGSAAATVAAGAGLGIGLNVVYAVAVGGPVSLGQVLLTSYLAIGLLAMVKVMDALVIRVLRRWLLPLPAKREGEAESHRREPRLSARSAVALVMFGRVVVLVAIGLPWVMAAAMTYRPKVVPPATPASDIGAPFTTETFHSADGTRLVGWWMPAPLHGTSPTGRTESPTQTVLLVHGLGGGKADVLVTAGLLLQQGFNVFAIDLRAHGQSGGQLCTFGAKETQDVLAAAAWVKANHPAEARELFGLGASMGAAALVAAAGEASVAGDAFNAIAVIGTFDDLHDLAATAVAGQWPPPVSWAVRYVAWPLASLHAGVNLGDVKPAEAIARIWPRPVMIVHAQNDEIIPFRHGQALAQAAFEPTRELWVPSGGHNSVLNNPDVIAAITAFFREARPRAVV